MFGELGIKLVAANRQPTFQSYDAHLVRETLAETRHIAGLVQQIFQHKTDGSSDKSDEELRAAVTLHVKCLKRNKKCLLAYHAHRIDKIKEFVWSGTEQEHAALLSPAEVDFCREYSKLVQDL